MKTIEEKAKAYDSIIEKANKMHSENCEACQACIEELIPELAESEDEKMMKEIIDLIMQPIWKTEKEFHRRNELCAWIKKQGQVKESHISQHENRTCEENGNSLTYEDERIRKEIINYFRCQSEEEPTRKEIHNKWLAWLENIPYTIDHEKREGFHLGYKAGLEKQDEQKFEMKTAEESLGIDSDTCNKIVDECIYGDDKVEPIFDVGDILEDKTTHLLYDVIGFVNQSYIVVPRTDGTIPFDLQDNFAVKARGICETGNPQQYTKVDYTKINIKQKDFSEATKALKPKFKVGDKIYLKPEYRMPDDDTPIANTVKEVRRIDDKHYRFDGSYIFIEDQDKYELVEQKPEENKGNLGGISPNWSEEDERLCQCLIEDQEEALDKVRNNKYGHSEIILDLKEMYHERIDWLKSLKQRIMKGE